MRQTLRAVVFTSLVLAPSPLRANDSAEARALLARAIKALGGKENLAKLQAVTWKGKGTVEEAGMKAELTDEWSIRGLDQYRWSLQAQAEQGAESGVLVLNKEKGWIKDDNSGQTEDLTKQKDAFRLLRTDLRAVRLAQCLLPLEEKGYYLSHLGELRINGRDAVGIKVSQKGWPDIDLFFDKHTFLPLRVEIRLKESDNGDEAVHTYYFEAYKKVAGVRHFTKLTFFRNDQPLLKMQLSDIQPNAILDDNVFDKP